MGSTPEGARLLGSPTGTGGIPIAGEVPLWAKDLGSFLKPVTGGGTLTIDQTAGPEHISPVGTTASSRSGSAAHCHGPQVADTSSAYTHNKALRSLPSLPAQPLGGGDGLYRRQTGFTAKGGADPRGSRLI